MRIRDWLPQAVTRLAGSESPRRDAEVLLGFVTAKSRSWLKAFDETRLDEGQIAALDALLSRRAQGEPVAYLTGEREFWSLPLRVSADTLIPRPDTEVLVERALAVMSAQAGEALDLGTGTGAIALALASERPDWHVTGVDRIAAAVALAQRNGATLAIANASFSHSDWFSALAQRHFALIVSNPPYIDAADPHLAQGDVRFEPLSALVSSGEGLDDIRHIASQARGHLLPAGWLLLEHGWQQGDAVRAILQAAGYDAVTTWRDYGGNERVTGGCWPSQTAG